MLPDSILPHSRSHYVPDEKKGEKLEKVGGKIVTNQSPFYFNRNS